MRAAKGAVSDHAAMSPTPVSITNVRLAWQTDHLEECAAFYGEGLGLPQLGRFDDHDGYSGVLIGMPGAGVHLELTHHATGSAATKGAADDLLVLYLSDVTAVDALVEGLARQGHPTVAPANPYWEKEGARAVADPDGRTVVLMPRPFD